MSGMRPDPDDEFYVGYEDSIPAHIGGHVRRTIAGFACAAAAIVLTVLFASSTLPASTFEYGTETEFTGVLRRVPYPVLEVGTRRIWLVGRGKWGADTMLAHVADGPVTVRGARIQRGQHEMLELAAWKAEPGTARFPTQVPHSEVVTLRGEIVDSKCFLGVMNPAEGAVHRDCARRCLSGGMPPMLLVRDGVHREELVVLVSADGRALSRAIAPAAGVPVEVSGRLARDGGAYVLYASGWRRQG